MEAVAVVTQGCSWVAMSEAEDRELVDAGAGEEAQDKPERKKGKVGHIAVRESAGKARLICLPLWLRRVRRSLLPPRG